MVRIDPASPQWARDFARDVQRELDTLPARIEALEAEQTALAAQLADPALYAQDAAKARELQARHDAIDEQLLAALERWETLGAR